MLMDYINNLDLTPSSCSHGVRLYGVPGLTTERF